MIYSKYRIQKTEFRRQNSEDKRQIILKKEVKKQMVLDACRKKEVVESFKGHENDTGSPAVQIALITERIKYLTEHFKEHQKDFGSRRGLLKLVAQRRRLLDYLKAHQPQKYKEILERLDLRK